ncbi:MAG: UDP-3-O-(3-hydroxymyristoyl)glucosamine N-acyltransferase [Phycisphaerae bacterium]|nr:UDP-3-O-(3-hydroxymyristoyl)glucosamine N-acyltransferase [Phycisphaerae bacterium]
MATALFTTGELAQSLGARLEGPADLPLHGVATIESAEPGTLTFVRSRDFARGWASCRASAAIVPEGLELPGAPEGRAVLRVRNADHALIVVLDRLSRALQAPRPAPGPHPSAVVDPSAIVAPGAVVGPLCTVGAGARIEEGAWLHARVHVGAGARVGRGSVLHPGVTLYDRCEVGTACILHAGVVIGADGFGYVPAPPELAASTGGVLKIPHVGNVVVGDLVEIGANSCVDRAKFGSTTIGTATKIDNLVQIGHGARIGRACLICGGCGVAGSVVLEDGVTLAGQVGVKDGIRVGAGATILAQAGVVNDVPPGERWWGCPAMPLRRHVRMENALRKLAGMQRLSESADQRPQ